MASTSLPGLLLKGLSMGAKELADTYTGKKLFDMMKSINKNKAAVNQYLKDNPTKGVKNADSFIKKVATGKNKRKDIITKQDRLQDMKESDAGKLLKDLKPGPSVSVRKKGGTIVKKPMGGKVYKNTVSRKHGGAIGTGTALRGFGKGYKKG
jgi:hypothetical protein|tara:strand:- start:76 stop:531 length:456 start_codon:yes stop_codon:yes gene_type:complete